MANKIKIKANKDFYRDIYFSTFIIKAIEGGLRINNNLFKVIAILQHKMDFKNFLSYLMADDKYSDRIFDLLAFRKLDPKIKEKMIIFAF